MNREGFQHGMVSKYPILGPSFHPRPEPRYTNQRDSPLTARLFAKVSKKPANQSKLTDKCSRPKCSRCHTCPVSKSRPKEKGTHKLRSCDVVSNHRLVSWRVGGTKPGLKFAGFSASGVLDHLDREYLDMEDDDSVDEVYKSSSSCELAFNGSLELEIASGAIIKDGDDGNKGDVEVVDMGFYNEEEEDGDYCSVVEMYL